MNECRWLKFQEAARWSTNWTKQVVSSRFSCTLFLRHIQTYLSLNLILEPIFMMYSAEYEIFKLAMYRTKILVDFLSVIVNFYNKFNFMGANSFGFKNTQNYYQPTVLKAYFILNWGGNGNFFHNRLTVCCTRQWCTRTTTGSFHVHFVRIVTLWMCLSSCRYATFLHLNM